MFYLVAIGDALGVPYEFSRTTHKIEYSKYLNNTPFDIQFQFAKTHVPACSVSDDTFMTLALLKALVKNRMRYRKEDVLLEYMNFANNCFMLGRNTRKLLKNIKTNKWI